MALKRYRKTAFAVTRFRALDCFDGPPFLFIGVRYRERWYSQRRFALYWPIGSCALATTCQRPSRFWKT